MCRDQGALAGTLKPARAPPRDAALSDRAGGGLFPQWSGADHGFGWKLPPLKSIASMLAFIHGKETRMTNKQNPRDKQPPHTGKVENDTNKVGEQAPTQINEGRRTPDSRSDRQAHIGSGNQTQSRRGDTKGH